MPQRYFTNHMPLENVDLCPLVSVVIPCFNGADYVKEAVDSALQQTYPAIEIIVVDDGSTDNSPAILAAYGERIQVIRQVNRGLPAARNSGIQKSQGAYLAFLDCDDYWDPTFIEKSIEALQQSKAMISYCGWQNIGLPGHRGRPYVPPNYEEMDNKLELMIQTPCWPVHAAVIKREVLMAAGGFDEHWKSCEDFALWIQTATQHPLVLVPEVLAYYRHHGTQMTRNRAMIVINHWRVQQDYLTKHPEVLKLIPKKRLLEITDGELLNKGFECYWAQPRQLEAARQIFRLVMRRRYGEWRHWKYMLPSLLPLSWHRRLIATLENETKPKQDGEMSP